MNASLAELIDTKLSEARAEDVVVTDNALIVELDDGRTISAPLAWYPRLAHGTMAERDNWNITAAGWGISWPDLDEDVSVRGLLIGNPSAETQRSLKRWLDSRAALGVNGSQQARASSPVSI